MVSPQLMAQAVTHLCFEANTMTAEALSPPNPVESLREQLIREGKIVPAKNESDALNGINDEVNHYIVFFNNTFIRSEYTQLIARVCRQAKSLLAKADSIEDSDAERKNKNLIVAYLRILSLTSLKSLNKLIFILFKNLSGQVSILRSGFFFAFKENMKNTP